MLLQDAAPNSVETVEPAVPIGAALLQLGVMYDDDVTHLENFVMEDSEIPLNMRLLQQDDNVDNMETMTLEDIPSDTRFVHITNNAGDELIQIEKI